MTCHTKKVMLYVRSVKCHGCISRDITTRTIGILTVQWPIYNVELEISWMPCFCISAALFGPFLFAFSIHNFRPQDAYRSPAEWYRREDLVSGREDVTPRPSICMQRNTSNEGVNVDLFLYMYIWVLALCYIKQQLMFACTNLVIARVF